VTLAFVRFFDWDQLAERSFEFVEVEIQRFDARPQLVGRGALIRCDGARIVWRAPTSSAAA
jgi:hypothetical protein